MEGREFRRVVMLEVIGEKWVKIGGWGLMGVCGRGIGSYDGMSDEVYLR